MENNPRLGERWFKYIFHALCFSATVGFTVYCVYQYLLDEDVARIEFEEFNSDINNIYPTISLCFPSPLSEDKLEKYGEGINISTYSSFLTGQSGSWDDRMAQIDYDDVSLNIEDYFLGKINVYLVIHTHTHTQYFIYI